MVPLVLGQSLEGVAIGAADDGVDIEKDDENLECAVTVVRVAMLTVTVPPLLFRAAAAPPTAPPTVAPRMTMERRPKTSQNDAFVLPWWSIREPPPPTLAVTEMSTACLVGTASGSSWETTWAPSELLV